VLVLLSFGLVLVATVLLVLGLLADDGLTLIYVSIACSVLAGVVLVVATRLGRPKAGTESAGPAPLPETSAPPAPAPAPASAPVADTLPRSEPVPPDDSFAPEPETVTVPPVETVPDEDDEDFFPIADYDDLRVNEILPLLPELYADEIDVVEEKERSGKSRATILNRLAELREVLADAPPDTTAAQVLAERPAPGKKATAKRSAAAKTPTKKAGAKKVVVEPTDATAKRAPSPSATKKQAGAKKAPAKKAAAAKKATRATKKA
jgi:hypothetical protein